jgi:hypothetical protein
MSKLIIRNQSAVVLELLFKIIVHFYEHYRQFFEKHIKYNEIAEYLRKVTSKMIQTYFGNFDLIVPMNMGYSIAIKECLHLHIDLISKYI